MFFWNIYRYLRQNYSFPFLSVLPASSMDQLPEDLLFMVLQHAQNTPEQRSFANFLLTCRRGYNIGLPMFCNAIALHDNNLEAFLTGFPSRNLHLVRFLTVELTDCTYVFLDYLARQRQHRRLQRLAVVLTQMVNLSTFSFIYNDRTCPNPRQEQIPGYIIAGLVDGLPMSCVNLEIDTHGLDDFEPLAAHLCDSLRHVLPRLQHLRLRMGWICPAIFVTGGTTETFVTGLRDPGELRPVVASSLKTVVMNYRIGLWNSRCCGDFDRHSAYVPFLEILPEMAALGAFPAIERLWIVYKPHIQFMAPQYISYKRCDVIQNQTWAIPFISATCPNVAQNRNVCLIRTPEGREVLTHDDYLEQFIEGETWVTIPNGCSVPAAAIGTRGLISSNPLPVVDLAPYQPFFDQCTCNFHLLWRNERITGRQLMSAILREDPLDESPVLIICPQGWRWSGNPFGSLLEPLVVWTHFRDLCFFANGAGQLGMSYRRDGAILSHVHSWAFWRDITVRRLIWHHHQQCNAQPLSCCWE